MQPGYRFFAAELDLFELVRDDHARQREWLQALSRPNLSLPERQQGALELGHWLSVHAAAERATLYATLREQEAGELAVLCSIDEHRYINQLLRELWMLSERASPTAWARAVQALSREIEAHQEEEEHAIFCLLGEHISAQQRVQLAHDYQRETGLQHMLLQPELPA
ncbi:hemerythrin domain-containing protein [Pseudomarimonas arenosa]|uniref:Hemerythrin-like domain-containing protein n=1 Tax=Pseudomarimonas arenosa TaxID=2774145 RepID=A0AAW3ZJW2_9GAMM|nr:hemerythrin domain-containing protein [Pseudomarimonas arenosa]MBD8525220.1 hypothetical protein [Pseudomarimonas arenosa]